MIFKKIFFFLILSFLTSNLLLAQYFGRNKPHYKTLEFKINRTPHLDIYHYLKNDSLIKDFSSKAEGWYHLHQKTLKDTINFKNPVILYENHADFQQTTVISGIVSVGTGGVTEAFKNRVIMPLMESRAQTSHVLGHELVHAFQYNLMRKTDSVSIYSSEIPLWMVEGMAEYLSVGRIDPNTAMWMRDAVLNDDIPTLKKLSTDLRYFPYRYGHAFWAYATGIWSDTVIKPLFLEAAKSGYKLAISKVLNMTEDSLSTLWKNSLKNYYEPYKQISKTESVGKKLIEERNAGEMNISPVISPDGKLMAFFSEKELFSIDLFLADAESGKIIKRLTGTRQTTHIDQLSFIESAGTWSPNSNQFAYVVYEKGRNKLYIINALSGKLLKKIEIPGLQSFSSPAWSPDGKYIVVSGFMDGQSDLYLYEINSNSVKKLTDDIYSDIQPSWSSDGKNIVFSSDRLSNKFYPQRLKYTFNISILDLADKKVRTLDVFPGANNLNPVYSNVDTSIYFLSDADGFRNIYCYHLTSYKVYKLSNFFTGVSGLTELSPAMSAARAVDKVVFSFYNKRRYEIYSAVKNDFEYLETNPDSLNYEAAKLPTSGDRPDLNIAGNLKYKILSSDSISTLKYKPKFKLDFIGNTGVGIATSRYGTGLAGGIITLFSDVLGYNQIFAGLSVNGQIQDIAGAVAYINQKRKISYGAGYSHIPYLLSTLSVGVTPVIYEGDTVNALNYSFDVLRTFENQVSIFGIYPLSQTRRFELGTAFTVYNYSLERTSSYFLGDILIDEKKEKLPAPERFYFGQVNIAYVIDNSFFGIASPMRGYRSRYQLEKYIDGINIYTLLIDQRIYRYRKPFSYAYRIYYYARYGIDEESTRLSPLFLGYPTLLHGYDAYSFYETVEEENLSIDQLIGSRMLISNIELRLPFTGPKRLTLIKSDYVLTELAYFIDGGIAWEAGDKLSLTDGEVSSSIKRIPVFSTGLSLRINLFGMLVLEPYYAFPLQRTNLKYGVLGLNLAAGW